MKSVGWLALFFSFSLLWACDAGPNEKTRHPLKQSHPYPDTASPSTRHSNQGGNVDTENEVEDIYTLHRDIWQNPLGVINSMGDLTGKTVADIGAGPYGYFTIQIAAKTGVEKVIAIDIDQDALDFIENAKEILDNEQISSRIETRLVPPDDPKINSGEADIILIVNTAVYFEDRIAYLKNLRKGLAPGGKVVLIDFKMRNMPIGPPLSSRIPIGIMEQELMAAGYTSIKSDDRTLEYQYIVFAGN